MAEPTSIKFKTDIKDKNGNSYIASISGKVTKAIGGIEKDTTYTNASIGDVLTDLLFQYVAPSNFTITTTAPAGIYEYGTEVKISKVTPKFTLGSEPINSITIGTTNTGNDLYSGTSATSETEIELDTTKTFYGDDGGTIYCTISDGKKSLTHNVSVTYDYYPYAIASTSDILSSVTSGANKSYSTSNTEFSLTLETDSYIWFLLPPSTSGSKTIQYKALSQWYDFTGGTADPVDVSLKLNSGITVTYKGYRTNKMATAGTTSFKIV